ncbi:MAG: hypothetical protein CSYNP_00794 [Syntrophus sp. SKADARSKE-3]|nr:hypothetical protein [Syntrophus sp. SKADARSKE-3]
MALSEFTRKLIETKLTEYCDKRFPKDIQDQIKLIFKIRGNNVTLIETRPFYRDPSIWTEVPVAQFRYDEPSHKWFLYYPDRNSRWHSYSGVIPTANLDVIFKEIDRDPTGIFWG